MESIEAIENSTSLSGRRSIFFWSTLTGIVYYFSNPNPFWNPYPGYIYDYTFRVAENFLRGEIGFAERQPSWLNEFVPFGDLYYSVFPLGSVLTMLPFAFLKFTGLIRDLPSALIAALIAASCCVFLFLIANWYDITRPRRILMALGILFGTWTWTNLTYGGAWQIALGFAMLGELGAIYFTVYNRRPMIAGLFFALAFGNRTEVLLTAPVFLYLIYILGEKGIGRQGGEETVPATTGDRKSKIASITAFCVIPFILGILTLIYNYVRFHSFTDFGYARIPGVLNEPWYRHGIFSFYYIPTQAWEMLLAPWLLKNDFPYLVLDGFGNSILWSSPIILFAVRFRARDRALKYAAWVSIIVLTLLLWTHGNSGGWQFGYRYAMVCLPWLFVVLLESAPRKLTEFEWAAYGFSILANAYATWLFHWTEYVKP